MKELNAPDKITQQMTRDGAIETNKATGGAERISGRELEFSPDTTDAELLTGAADRLLSERRAIKKRAVKKENAKIFKRVNLKEPNPKQVYFLFREDIRHMQNIARETRLLVKHGIDTGEQLTAYKDGLTAQMGDLCDNRKRLRNQARGIRDEEKLTLIKSDISLLSDQIGELRREVRLCEDIDRRSAEIFGI